jgi:fimbrial chaperone protein
MRSAGFAMGLLMLAEAVANAGEIGVAPLRIELSPQSRSAVVTVTGKTGPGQFLQVRAMRWTQDARGQDRYEETDDLVYLPKTIDLAKANKQLVRIGVERPVTDVEKSYRLFIRETPPPIDPGRKKGAQIAVVVDFGLPVFLMPAKPVRAAELQDILIDKGQLALRVTNTGTVRLKLVSLTAGKTPFAEFRQWYLLAGASQRYTVSLAAGTCKAPITLELRTETITVKREIPLTPQMCG